MRIVTLLVLAACFGTLVFTGTAEAKQVDLQDWVDQGRFIKVNGNKIFIVTAGKAEKKGHAVFIVHGR